MKKLVRCKVCGYVMEEGSLKDVCPACGVPKTAFEPYTSRVSEKRENILNLHIHPILIHLPQGLIIFLFILLIAGIIPTPFKSQILTTAVIIGIFLPIFVIIAIATGFFDGKIRYKKLKSPYLIIKIISGSALLVLSIAFSVLLLIGFNNLILMFCFSIGFLICSTVLGKIGAYLTEGKFPG